jgi:hypothetical protein
VTDTWLAIEARTGAVITEMPLLTIEGDTIKQTIGRYETATAHLPVSADVVPAEWKRATKKGAAFLIFVEDNPLDARGVPRWGGMVTRRRRNETDTVDLDLITVEGYLDRRYTGDLTFAATGQNTIAATLFGIVVDGAGGDNGIPLRVVNLDGAVGTLRDKTYKDQDDKSVYSALTEFMGILGGPEWTIGLEWVDATHIGFVAYVGARIGASPIAGLMPNASFDLPGNVSNFELAEDYGAGNGATDVMAVSSGEGTARPQSTHMISADVDRPSFEYRFTPSTSITDVATLNSHASDELAVVQGGTSTLTLKAQLDAAPKLGTDWNLGDDVSYDIDGSVPAFGPDGISGTARVGGLGADPLRHALHRPGARAPGRPP